MQAPAVVWLGAVPSGLSAVSERATRAHVLAAARVVVQVTPVEEGLEPAIQSAQEAVDALPARAALFIVQSTPEVANLYLFDGAQNQLWTRKIPRWNQSEELWGESIGLIAAAAIRSLVASRPVGMVEVPLPEISSPPRVEAELVAPVPSASTRGDTRKRWNGAATLTVGYRGGPFASTHRWTHGLDLGFAIVLANGASLVIGYEVLGPLEARGFESSIRLARHPIRGGAGFRWSLPKGFYIRPALLMALDVIGRRSSTTNPELQALAPQTLIEIGIVPSVDVGVAISRNFHVFLEARPEIWVQPRSYAVAVPQRLTVVEPYTFRPTFQVGLGGSLPAIAGGGRLGGARGGKKN